MRLLALRARRLDVPFDEWWEAAVRPGRPPMMMSTPLEERPAGCVLWPTDSADRNLWRAATDEARGGWRRAYANDTPSPAEQGLIMLMTLEGPLGQLLALPAPELEPEPVPLPALPEPVAA